MAFGLIFVWRNTVQVFGIKNNALSLYLCIIQIKDLKFLLFQKKLYAIRKLRNRIFHYEQIFKCPEKTLGLYNTIIEILSYLPTDGFNVVGNNSSFLNTYNEILNYKHLYR